MKRSSLAAAVLMSLGAPASPAAEKPDVLIVLTDQWSPRYLSWDNPQVKTPHLDRIAREGMIFDACYVASPVCMPARVSLITGLFPHNHGHALWGNASGYYPAAGAAPMFRDIRNAGYTTAQVGKLHWTSGPGWKQEFATLPDYHRALGLDHVVDVSGPPDSTQERNAYGRYLQERGLLEAVAKDIRRRYILWEFEPRASVASAEDYHDAFVTRAAVDFIGKQPKDKPLCLVVSLHSPHPPLDAPGEFATMHEADELKLPANVPAEFKRGTRTINHTELRRMAANYLGKISFADQCLGQLAAALEARGTWDEAMVVFTADHGEMMGAHGALTKGRFYEESVRVPLVIRWPGQVKAGRTQALVQMHDVYPTVVEAIGGELSPGRMAVSLLPVASGKKDAVRKLAISEIGDGPPLSIMARDDRFKYWEDKDGPHLFDLEEDPFEMKDMASSPEHQEAVNQMRHRLLTHLRSTQVNFAEGYKNKVQRLREAEAGKKGE